MVARYLAELNQVKIGIGAAVSCVMGIELEVRRHFCQFNSDGWRSNCKELQPVFWHWIVRVSDRMVEQEASLVGLWSTCCSSGGVGSARDEQMVVVGRGAGVEARASMGLDRSTRVQSISIEPRRRSHDCSSQLCLVVAGH